jgi:hypothetical protein
MGAYKELMKEFIGSDDAFEMISDMYFAIIEHLGIEDKCIEPDHESGGTRNTAFGRGLYYLIEDTILEAKDDV